MPIFDFTAKLLELKNVIIHDSQTSNTEVHVFFTLKRCSHYRLHCPTLTDNIHNYGPSIIEDLAFIGKKTLLHYSKRRYRCLSCKKHFYESFLYYLSTVVSQLDLPFGK